ncbi:MAG: heavy metal-associated domain-containing protein [Bacillota bacterium]|nr:heavy metal-associated domain-containing protein [Bacillota bacterium]
MNKIVIEVRGMHKEVAADSLRSVLTKIEGVREVELDNPNKQAIIIAEDDVDPKKIKEAMAVSDFSVGEYTVEPYTPKKKKGFFSFFRKGK